MEEIKAIKTDSGGFEALKPAIITLLNQFPGLTDGKEITFNGLTQEDGISVEMETGALVYTERKFITGEVKQECQLPFLVVYRSHPTSEFLKIGVNKFLDDLGTWICKEPVQIEDETYRLQEYPAITGGRKITNAVRFNSYALEPNENGSQDWVIPITVHYTHEFEKW